jgi:hypothetical protein
VTFGLLIALVLAQAAGETGKRIDLFKPAKAEKDAPSYRLDPEKDGLVYRGPQFTAHIARDGVVRFTDKAPVKPYLPLPVPLPPGTPTLWSSIQDHLAHRPRKTAPSSNEPTPPPQVANQTPSIWPSASQVAQTDCENHNDPRCPFPKYAKGSPKVVSGGGFVDWDRFLLGLPKNEKAREEKARFLAATEPLRTRMATEAHAENLEAALWDLPALLDRIWSKTEYPPAERRRLLHELWHEYAEMPGNESACATIVAFIRRHLPKGSPDAYTPDELARLRPDAGPRFDPY